MSYKPYVIVAPNWETTSGGVRVMYGLYGWLLAKGQIAYLNAYPNGEDFIAIYPEIQQGNPTNAKTVVRYILNKPGVVPALMSDGSIVRGPTEYAPTDKLYYFSRLFGEAQDDNHYLFLPILNTHLFKDQDRKRTRVAYFVGKGINDPQLRSKFIHPDSAVLIDRDLAQDQGELADLLNECEVLYCYDPVSAMTELCRLCGCRVVMINPIYSRLEFEKYEPGMNGISWGEDQGKKLDVEEFTEDYEGLKLDFDLALDRFIEETQS